jgi:hypothetical protein
MGWLYRVCALRQPGSRKQKGGEIPAFLLSNVTRESTDQVNAIDLFLRSARRFSR